MSPGPGKAALALWIAGWGLLLGPAAAQERGDSVEALRRRLAEREAVIDDLLRRVEALEQRLAAAPPQAPPPAAPSAAARPPADPSPPSPRPVAAAAAPPAAAPAASAAPADAAPPQEAANGRPPGKPGPGQFTVEEEEIDRALERALVEAGAMLLPPGMLEVGPGFGYTRRERQIPGDVVLLDGQAGLVSSENLFRRDTYEADLTFRLGLPRESQVQLRLPWVDDDRSLVGRANGAGFRETSGGVSGLGDIRLGFTKELLREQGAWPSLFAAIDWDSDTGEREKGVSAGSGFNELRLSLTGAKRQDPLVFTGAISWERAFENDDIEPGDELGLSLGTLLAVTPATSLGFSFDQTFSRKAEFQGREIPGSDTVQGMFTSSLSAIVAPRTLLNVSVGVGVTDDAPDYAFRVALPIRFQLPLLSR